MIENLNALEECQFHGHFAPPDDSSYSPRRRVARSAPPLGVSSEAIASSLVTYAAALTPHTGTLDVQKRRSDLHWWTVSARNSVTFGASLWGSR